ncbi:MAG: hypothetical protein M0Q43_07570 [Methanothrix sp.]|jgi:hypothetical protein|nr:hypothetical protein [Methanothrix sp.]
MSTLYDIYNLALARVKSNKLLYDGGPSEMAKEAELCALFYPIARDAVLESAYWDFTTRRSVLTLWGTENGAGTRADPKSPTNWAFSYLAPYDMLKARDIVGYRNPTLQQRIPFEVVSEEWEETSPPLAMKVICTDQEDAELIYTALIDEVLFFTPLFVSAVAWAMAIELNMALSKGLNDSTLRASLQLDINRAVASNYGEGRSDVPNDSPFVTDYR